MKNIFSSSPRLEVVDALRGFALLGIILIHNLEHYNLYYFPENQPAWLDALDKGIWETVFFLFSGKSFATFSMLFGFSFFIQMDNQARRGYDFRLRFAWRLMLLLCVFAQLHALFYNGDILVMYALCGFMLIPVWKLSNRTVTALAFFLLAQPFEWYRMFRALIDPHYNTLIGSFSHAYGEKSFAVLEHSGWQEALYSNITDGQLYSNFWQVENGRLFLIPALFMFGMLLGRTKAFVKSKESNRFWKRTLTISTLLFVIIYTFHLSPLSASLETDISKSFRTAYRVMIGSYQNFAFMCILISAFTLLWFKRKEGYGIQRMLIPYGRMSLTNYISQSIIGSILYYGYGVGLWEKTGASVSFLIACGIFTIQLLFSQWWLSHHKQGPLEYLWKKWTWIGRKNK